MARANLNKSEWLGTITAKASEYIPQNLHQLKCPFLTQIYLVKVPLNVSVVM